MARPQALIFDLDGTLIDSRGDIAAALNHHRASHGLEPLSLEAVLPMIGNGLPKLVERGLEGTGLNLEEGIAGVTAAYAENPFVHTKVYEGVKETLAHIHLPMAVVSNKATSLMKPVLKAAGLFDSFETVYGGEDFPHRKPHPDAGLALLESWKLPAEEVWMIGDMAPDAHFAKNLGCPFVHCTFGYGQESLDAQHEIHSFGELRDLIQ